MLQPKDVVTHLKLSGLVIVTGLLGLSTLGSPIGDISSIWQLFTEVK